MKEIHEILQASEALKNSERGGILATIVKVKGSTYRRAGARMLIRDDGSSVGTLSSGCLEADVIERAKKIMETHDAITVTYDLTSPQNDVWGLNMGCNGVIHVLLEPLPLSARSPHLRFLSDCIGAGKSGAIATVFRVEGELKVTVGSQLFLAQDGHIKENIKNPPLAAALTEECLEALRTRSSRNQEIRLTEGVVEAFIEVVEPPLTLLIFGAGADAIPLARVAGDLGWSVTVIDHRPALLNKERYPTADQLLVLRPEEAADKVPIKPEAAAVILTHDFSHDLQLLRMLLPSQAAYVGLIGPSKRGELLLQKVRETGFTPSPQQLSRLHSPVGLDIGAESPEEIALSILSEIRAFMSGRRAGFLRDHVGPIHGG